MSRFFAPHFAGLILLGLVLGACQVPGQAEFDRWEPKFVHRPAEFTSSVTALWISGYQEEASTKRFVRYSAFGAVPEKMVPDGNGTYTVLVSLHRQAETSDGPVADQVVDYLVRVARDGDKFRFLPTDPLPQPVAVYHDAWNRTVHVRGYSQDDTKGLATVAWEFQGRY
ncbi:MAG: hypothetical protein WCG80_14315 [Spirochaetales bacterium]